jgi:hypothetical protein
VTISGPFSTRMGVCVDRITTLESSLRLFILVDDRFGRSFRRLFDDPGGDFDDVPSNVVVLFWTIIYGRHSRGAVTVVRLLGDEPIRCPLSRRGSFFGRRTGYAC